MDLRKTYLEQRELVVDHLAPFANQILQAATPFQVWITSWCIENYVPLAQLQSGDVYLVFYERLKACPIRELANLFTFLGITFDRYALKHLNVPSATSRGSSEQLAVGNNSINGWRNYVTGAEAASADRILKRFGLDAVYGRHAIPDATRAADLLAKTKGTTG
jgi:hypothetical protein